MSVESNEIKNYYREINKALPGSPNAKKRIMDSIHQAVENYLQEYPQTDIADVQHHFGTPDDIASSYVEQLETHVVIRRLDIKKAIIIAVCSTLVLALLLWIIGLAIALVDEHKSDNGSFESHPVVEIETEEMK